MNTTTKKYVCIDTDDELDYDENDFCDWVGNNKFQSGFQTIRL